MKAPITFPSRLVLWRKKRGLSQLQLAMAAACSQRHVGFLELGRTKPSREMVLHLAAALDVPLRQSNELLLAAGFAPAWSETELGAEALVPIRPSKKLCRPWLSIVVGTCCSPTKALLRWSSSSSAQ
jgi:transcriptional regulator with XRE-family HTH domain